MSRRRSHCPKRGRGRGGGPWPAGEGLGLRGPGAGAREEHVGSCPPFSPLPGQERGPGTNWSRQPGEGAGPQAGEGARALLRLRLLFRLRVLQRSGLGSFLRVQSSENFAPPPRLPPRQTSPGWVGGGGAFVRRVTALGVFGLQS